MTTNDPTLEILAAVLRMRAVLRHVQRDDDERRRLQAWLDDVAHDPANLAVELTTSLDELVWRRGALCEPASGLPGHRQEWVRTGRRVADHGSSRRGDLEVAAGIEALPNQAVARVLSRWAAAVDVRSCALLESGDDPAAWGAVELVLPKEERVEDVLDALDAFDALGIPTPGDGPVGVLMHPLDDTPLRLRVGTSAMGLTSVGIVSGPIPEERLVELIRTTAGDAAVEPVAALQGVLGGRPPTAVEATVRPDGATARLAYVPSSTPTDDRRDPSALRFKGRSRDL